MNMGREERVYELSYIKSHEHVAKIRDFRTCFSGGNLMIRKLKASNEKGEYHIEEDYGKIDDVHFLSPELNTEERRKLIRPWEFNHKIEDKKEYSYKEFLSLWKSVHHFMSNSKNLGVN